jgi:type II secretory pathway component PulL
VSSKKINFYDENFKIIHSTDAKLGKKSTELLGDKDDIAILLSTDFSFYKFDLPKTSQRNLNKAIPFMLGEELLGDIKDYFWIHDSSNGIVGTIEHENIKSIKNNLKRDESVLIPIQALSSSKQNLLVILQDKAFISLKDNWFWLADSKSITNTLDLIISRYEINNLEVWSVNKDIQLPQLTIDLETKTFSSELELLKSFAEILNLNNPFNFFVKEYEKKIDWFSLFSRYKFYVYSALGLFAIFFASAIIQFSYLSISNSLLKDKIMDTFKEKFPSETLESDLISQVNGLINQGQIDYSALNAISIISDAVSSSENIILVSIGYEQTRFIIEVQTNSYDQLQDYVDFSKFVRSGSKFRGFKKSK